MKTTRPQPIRYAALLALAILVVAPTAVSQQFPAVLMARHKIDLKGNGILTDSFDSQDFRKSDFGQYDPAIYAGDKGDVVSCASVVGTINVGNAHIYGKAHTGVEGTVTAATDGAVGSHAWQAANPGLDFQPGWVLQDATNFTFPDTSLPYSDGLPLGGPQTVVVVTYDHTNAIYTTNYYDHVITYGDYYCWRDDLYGSTIVLGHARLVLPDGLAMSGVDQITIAPGASFKIHCGGTSCTVGGNGVLNLAGYAKDFILQCTSSVTNFTVNVNGKFIGVLVAPDAALTMNGAGHAANDFIGALMMNSVTLNGHFGCHYDEALTVNPLPALRIEQQRGGVVISWPASLCAFVLQAADTLSAPSWDDVPLDIVTNGSLATVTLPATNAHRYFRLQGP